MKNQKALPAVTAALDAAGVPYTSTRVWSAASLLHTHHFEFTHGGLGAQKRLARRGPLRRPKRASADESSRHRFAMGLDRWFDSAVHGTGPKGCHRRWPTSLPIGENLNAAALVLARELRRAAFVELGDGSFRLKSPLKRRQDPGASSSGEDELQSVSESEGFRIRGSS